MTDLFYILLVYATNIHLLLITFKIFLIILYIL